MSKSFVRPAAVFAAVSMIVLAACSSKEAAEPAATAAAPAAGVISPDASVIDLMNATIVPAAEALWNSVGSVSTAEGTKDLAPSTDAEWAAVRKHAQALVDGAKALMEPARVVAHPGQKLKEPAGPGDLTPEQAQAAISKDRAAFVAFSTAMQGVASEYLAAIDKKDVDAFSEAGGKLDGVCESCHKRFWYPESGAPPAP